MTNRKSGTGRRGMGVQAVGQLDCGELWPLGSTSTATPSPVASVARTDAQIPLGQGWGGISSTRAG